MVRIRLARFFFPSVSHEFFFFSGFIFFSFFFHSVIHPLSNLSSFNELTKVVKFNLKLYIYIIFFVILALGSSSKSVKSRIHFMATDVG